SGSSGLLHRHSAALRELRGCLAALGALELVGHWSSPPLETRGGLASRVVVGRTSTEASFGPCGGEAKTRVRGGLAAPVAAAVPSCHGMACHPAPAPPRQPRPPAP